MRSRWKVRLLAGVLILGVCPFVTGQDKWTPAAASKHRDVYYRGLSRAGAIVTFWERSLSDNDDESIARVQIDCQRSLHRVRSITRYDTDGQVISSTGGDTPWSVWWEIIPDSVGEQEQQTVCGRRAFSFYEYPISQQ